MAVAFHGLARFTIDIDLRISESSYGKLKESLEKMAIEESATLGKKIQQQIQKFRFSTEGDLKAKKLKPKPRIKQKGK